MTSSRAWLVVLPLLVLACDLPPKDIGDESESNGGSGSGSDGGDSDGSGTDGTPACNDGDTMLAPDGCNTCTCTDGAFACTELGCTGWFGDEILICPDGAPQDPFDFVTTVIALDKLIVNLGYGGGCETHEFGLCWDGSFAESSPVQIQVFISHESNDDTCEAYINDQLAFDLTPLADAWHEAYGPGSGEIEINVAGLSSHLYEFE